MKNMNHTTQSFEYLDQYVPSDKPVRLAWLDQRGQIRCVAGRCIDVSSRRIHVEVPEHIPLNTRVMLRAGGRHIAGAACVKYVTHYNTGFILVLETG
jgi:hypothetical protein